MAALRLYDSRRDQPLLEQPRLQYINERYLVAFLKSRLLGSKVRHELLHSAEFERGSLTELQFQQIVERAHADQFHVDQQAVKVARHFERCVADLFVVKFSVLFNHYWRLFSSDHTSSFADFLDAAFDESIRGCFAPSSNLEDFFHGLELDMSSDESHEIQENGDSVLVFFDPSSRYQRELERLVDDLQLLQDTEVSRVVAQLLNIMNYQMHLSIVAPLFNDLALESDRRWAECWQFLVLAGWMLGAPLDFGVVFSSGCDHNYRQMLQLLPQLRVGTSSLDTARRLMQALGMRLEDEPLERLVVFVVCSTADKLPDDVSEWREYALRHLNGVDTQSGVDFFRRKKLLSDSAFRQCGFAGVSRLGKERPCTFWAPRRSLWVMLGDNSKDAAAELLQQESKQEAPPDDVQTLDRDGERSLLADMFEMHCDIVLSVWLLLLRHWHRVKRAPLSLEDFAALALLATCVQTANFGVEGTLDMLEYLLDHK